MLTPERLLQLWALLTLSAFNRQILTDGIVGRLIGVLAQDLEPLLEQIQSYCRANKLPLLALLVVDEDTGLPVLRACSPENISRQQFAVFQFDWLDCGPPTSRALAEAVTERAFLASSAEPATVGGTLGEIAKGTIGQARIAVIESYWPAIEQVFREKFAPAALHAAKDDETVGAIATRLYPVLPMAIRLLVREPDFVTFCIANRDKMLLFASTAAPAGDGGGHGDK